jgi:hypothetical protein
MKYLLAGLLFSSLAFAQTSTCTLNRALSIVTNIDCADRPIIDCADGFSGTLRSLYTLPHSSTYAVDVIELPPSPAQVIPSEKPSTRLRIERLIPLSELILSPRHGDSNEKGPKKNDEPASKQTDAADPQ